MSILFSILRKKWVNTFHLSRIMAQFFDSGQFYLLVYYNDVGDTISNHLDQLSHF